MNDKEKKIINLLKKELPTMSEFDKGYLLGFVEMLASKRKNKLPTRKEENNE